MNSEEIAFQLDQAISGLVQLSASVKRGEYGESSDLALAVRMATVVNYINNAWHYRGLSRLQIEMLSDEEYEILANTIPLFDVRLTLQSILE